MRKFITFLSLFLIGTISFAQNIRDYDENFVVEPSQHEAKTTAWHGVSNSNGNTQETFLATEFFFFKPWMVEGALTSGERVTKVKVHVLQSASISANPPTSGTVTIEIYQGVDTSALYANNPTLAALGTLVSSEVATVEFGTETIITLQNPYTITDQLYVVVVKPEGAYNFLEKVVTISTPFAYTEYLANQQVWRNYVISEPSEVVWLYKGAYSGQTPTLRSNVALYYYNSNRDSLQVREYIPYMSVYIEGEGEYQPSCNLEAGFLTGNTQPLVKYDNYAQVTISGTEPFPYTIYIENTGIDNLPVSNDNTFTVTANNSVLYTSYISNEDILEVGYIYLFTDAIATDVLAQLPGVFELKVESHSPYDSYTQDNKNVLVVNNLATSIKENTLNPLSVYPNPAKEMFTITNPEGAYLQVINSLGQVVYAVKNAPANCVINSANWVAGIYFVKIDTQVVKLNIMK